MPGSLAGQIFIQFLIISLQKRSQHQLFQTLLFLQIGFLELQRQSTVLLMLFKLVSGLECLEVLFSRVAEEEQSLHLPLRSLSNELVNQFHVHLHSLSVLRVDEEDGVCAQGVEGLPVGSVVRVSGAIDEDVLLRLVPSELALVQGEALSWELLLGKVQGLLCEETLARVVEAHQKYHLVVRSSLLH